MASITLTRGPDLPDSAAKSDFYALITGGSGTVTNIAQTDLSAGTGLVLRQNSQPTDNDALWVDTTGTVPTVKFYNGAEWQPAGPYGVFTNKSGGQVVAGDIVIVDTANGGSFKTTTTAGDVSVLGVVMETINNNSDGVVALAGARVTNLLVDATTAVGQYLKTSTTAKQASPTSNREKGTFAVALSSRAGSGLISEAVLIGVQGGVSLGAPVGSHKKLLVTRTSNSAVNVTADDVILDDGSSGTIRVTSINVNADIGTAGAGGLDTGAEAANTWYYIWVIRKSSDGTTNALLSVSATSPTMPSGYDQKALVSVVRNDGSSNFKNFKQANRIYYYVTNQVAASGNVGIGAWTSIDITGFVPATLSTFAFGQSGNNAGQVQVTNDNAVLATNVPDRNKVFAQASGIQACLTWQFEILTANTLWWESNVTDANIWVAGFHLNLL